MKKKSIFTIMIIFILIMTLFANISSVNATGLTESVNSAENFLGNGKSSLIDYDALYQIVSFLYNVAMTIGIIIAAIVGIVLGIRIIFGSLDERADAKNLLVPYLVIVGMIAFGFAIWRMVLNLIYKNI